MLRLLTVPVVLATKFLKAHAQNLQDCYGYDGAVQSDNVVCEGSGACCNAQATCTEQRLCHNQGDPENVFVRGPCSSRNWDGSICPQLCLYDEGDNMFPRVTQCPDGSWCCHQVFNVNSTTCCDQGQGTFLNDQGEVIDAPTSSSSSVIVSTVPLGTMSSTSETSITASQTSTQSPNPGDSGLSTGAKVGIGVGVGGGVLLTAGALAIGWFMMKRSRKAHQENIEKEASSMHQLGAGGGYNDVRAHYVDQPPQGQPVQYSQNEYFKPAVGSPPVEAPGSVPGHLYSDQGAVEADSGHHVGELPADVPSKPGEKK